MKLADDLTPANTLENMCRVVRFLNEGICCRTDDFSDEALCGAQLIFWALESDMMELCERLTKTPE